MLLQCFITGCGATGKTMCVTKRQSDYTSSWLIQCWLRFKLGSKSLVLTGQQTDKHCHLTLEILLMANEENRKMQH